MDRSDPPTFPKSIGGFISEVMSPANVAITLRILRPGIDILLRNYQESCEQALTLQQRVARSRPVINHLTLQSEVYVGCLDSFPLSSSLLFLSVQLNYYESNCLVFFIDLSSVRFYIKNNVDRFLILRLDRGRKEEEDRERELSTWVDLSHSGSMGASGTQAPNNLSSKISLTLTSQLTFTSHSWFTSLPRQTYICPNHRLCLACGQKGEQF
ncbi:hypothetical protein ACN38_g3562 [Penicillium nordicum]|uniref:Uncharacterized protein n=1 Tax=Penicillium nordicum TaxID=229535 RepID=A0A0M9WHW7_9EURO|nr:hypothetical protein ACN38_g3562 [Penicillium nordicum]